MRDLNWIQDEAKKYVNQLESFLTSNKLDNLGGNQIDHFAVKLANTNEYEEFVNFILPLCNSAQYIQMNNRRIATAELSKEIDFGNFGTCKFIEIMEPRPEKVGKDLVGFEHSELYMSNLSEIEKRLQSGKTQYEAYDNGFHKALVLKINDDGQEIKITNTTLVDVLKKEREEGVLIVLK